MRQSTVCIVYFAKVVELVAILTLTIWMAVRIIQMYWLVHEDEHHYLQMIIGMSITLVLMHYHLFYNNLLYNLRFKVKKRSYACGTYFVFDPLNGLWCSCFLKKPCQDRCFTPWTIGKWVVYLPFFLYMAHEVYNWRMQKLQSLTDLGIFDNLDEIEQQIVLDKYITQRLDIMYVIYAFQHPLYFIVRTLLFLVLKCFMLPCDPGQHLPDTTFRNLAISYEYIEYEEGLVGHFAEHHAGGLNQSIQFEQQLRVIRRESMRNQSIVRQQTHKHNKMSFTDRLRETIVQKINFATVAGDCPICMDKFKVSDAIVQLPCDTRHCMHLHCLEGYLETMAKYHKEIQCPFCRKPFTKEQVKRVKINLDKADDVDGQFEPETKIGAQGLVVVAPDVQSDVNMAFGSHVGLPDVGDQQIEMPPVLPPQVVEPEAPAPADNEVAAIAGDDDAGVDAGGDAGGDD